MPDRDAERVRGELAKSEAKGPGGSAYGQWHMSELTCGQSRHEANESNVKSLDNLFAYTDPGTSQSAPMLRQVQCSNRRVLFGALTSFDVRSSSEVGLRLSFGPLSWITPQELTTSWDECRTKIKAQVPALES
eukprot:4340258-Amphidinium_carterae.1